MALRVAELELEVERARQEVDELRCRLQEREDGLHASPLRGGGGQHDGGGCRRASDRKSDFSPKDQYRYLGTWYPGTCIYHGSTVDLV